tara:strand:- start:74935 stop:76056 length:1122 start_codon:yes stop_codon:yes gene_type:complete
MTSLLITILVCTLFLALAVFWLGWNFVKRFNSSSKGSELGIEIGRISEVAREGQVGLETRLKALTESSESFRSSINERLQAQEIKLNKTLEEGLHTSTKKTLETMSKLESRLAVIDKAQENIVELSGQMVGLQEILSNKQARGAFGEIQLYDLVRQVLPPSAFKDQAQLSNGKRPDCLLVLPNPPGPIAIDAKFPLESYHLLRSATSDSDRSSAARTFRDAIKVHIKDIAQKYIVPGETAEAALMFLPSEAVYAELHANAPEAVEASYRARVFIVSPTTLWATLNTVRAILKDVQMQEQAGLIQKEVGSLISDMGRLDDRVSKLQKHFDLAVRDVSEIRTSADKVIRRGERIESVEIEEVIEPSSTLGGPKKN